MGHRGSTLKLHARLEVTGGCGPVDSIELAYVSTSCWRAKKVVATFAFLPQRWLEMEHQGDLFNSTVKAAVVPLKRLKKKAGHTVVTVTCRAHGAAVHSGEATLAAVLEQLQPAEHDKEPVVHLKLAGGKSQGEEAAGPAMTTLSLNGLTCALDGALEQPAPGAGQSQEDASSQHEGEEEGGVEEEEEEDWETPDEDVHPAAPLEQPAPGEGQVPDDASSPHEAEEEGGVEEEEEEKEDWETPDEDDDDYEDCVEEMEAPHAGEKEQSSEGPVTPKGQGHGCTGGGVRRRLLDEEREAPHAGDEEQSSEGPVTPKGQGHGCTGGGVWRRVLDAAHTYAGVATVLMLGYNVWLEHGGA